MFQTKLIKLLRNFDKKELIQLGNFLESPFFFPGRKEERLIILYNYLKRFHPLFEHKKLAKEKVFEVVFPEKPYKEKQLQQLMTRFNKALERFIVQTYQSQNFGFPPPSLALATFYRKKNLLSYFKKLHEKEMGRQAQQKSKDINHFWVDFLLAKSLTEQQSLFNIRKSDLNLPQTLSRLDYFFLATNLESACVLLDQQKHHAPISTNGALKTIKTLQPLLDDGYCRDEPLIDLLYRTYHLLMNEVSLREFHELKKVYDQNAMEIGFDQRQMIYLILRNFSTQKLNEGAEEFLEPLFNLYQKGLLQGVMTFAGGILPQSFQSIVTLGLRLKKFAWVENFLEEYRNQLVLTEDPESIYTLNRASLLFARGTYQKALNCLTYEFGDIYLKLVARRLEIQIYYELQSDLLDTKIQAFKVFVFRIAPSRLTNLQRKGYNNFVDLLKQIIHPSTRFNEDRQVMLRKKIKEKKVVAERTWLLEKIEALE